jgi:hypothetical protein
MPLSLSNPPLSALLTSPPQGWRWFFSLADLELELGVLAADVVAISPLVGEMSRRDRGGCVNHKCECARGLPA